MNTYRESAERAWPQGEECPVPVWDTLSQRWTPHGTIVVSPALRSARGTGPPPGPPVGVDDYGPPATEARPAHGITRHPHTESEATRTDAHAHCTRHPRAAGPICGYTVHYTLSGHRYLSRLSLALSVSRGGSPSARRLAIRCPSARRQRRKARVRSTSSPPLIRRTTSQLPPPRHPATAYSGCRPFAKHSGAATNPLECCEHNIGAKAPLLVHR